MEATKHTLSITVETLSPDSFRAMLDRMMDALDNQMVEGTLVADDGDKVEWGLFSSKVKF
jgi:hypothetical protein